MRYSENESVYILGNFNDGDTVTIDVYRLSDDTKVVDGATCSEVGTTGVFKYNFSQTISSKTEYLWIMSNGTLDQRGKIVLGGYMDNIKIKTDNLPSDPASESQVETAISNAESNIRGDDNDDLKVLSDQIDVVDSNVDTIQTDVHFIKILILSD